MVSEERSGDSKWMRRKRDVIWSHVDRRATSFKSEGKKIAFQVYDSLGYCNDLSHLNGYCPSILLV